MTAESRRFLGYGLLAGAAGIALLMLAWLATSGVETGGAVLGLLLLFVLAGPLAAGGTFVLMQSGAVRREEAQFASKRHILEADRLFRAELARRIGELASTPTLPTEQLNRLAQQVSVSAPEDEAAWYGSIQLDDSQAAQLRQYDDLVWERVRWLRDHVADSEESVTQAVDQLRIAIDQRTDLLTRGRVAPGVAPAMLLEAAAPGASAIQSLNLGDAITREGVDYLVEGIATSFSDGQVWKLVHLVPSGPGSAEHRLNISPGGLELAWLDAIPLVDPPGGGQMTVNAKALPLVATRSASVEVQGRSGSAPAVLVRSWTYRAGELVGTVEQWPDGTLRAYAGQTIDARAVEIWPGVRTTEAAQTS